jgi:hypothetical protein
VIILFIKGFWGKGRQEGYGRGSAG